MMENAPQRTAWLPSVRAYQWERELVVRAAAAGQVKVTEFIRDALLAAAREATRPKRAA
jgi:uncharacterized protein (DUF1778 family)